MRKLQLDTILLFALVTPIIMTFRISSGETPYWLFGLIFISLLTYTYLDISNLSKATFFLSKKIVLWFVIIVVIGSAFVSSVIVRRQTAPEYMIHDIIIQQESAIRFLLHGKNPYATTYFGTPLEKWNYDSHEINPALYHFVMEPFYVIFAIPFYLTFAHTIGYFDGRIPLLFLFFIMLIAAWFTPKDENDKRVFVTLLAFNPAMFAYTLEGRSDIFMYAFLFVSLLFLQKRRFLLSSSMLAFAFMVKQSAWLIFPFYVYFLYLLTKSMKETIKVMIPFFVICVVLAGPFLVWDKSAYIDSTISYLSGSASHSYPISGYGFGKLLNSFGFIKDVHQYYPFQLWQIVIIFPLCVFLLRVLKKFPTVQQVIISYGIFLFVYWYFSRYFNNSHLGYITMLMITAYFWPSSKLLEK